MKGIFFTLSFLVILFKTYSQDEVLDTLRISDEFLLVESAPISIEKSSVVMFNGRRIYLFSELNYNYFKELRKAANDLDEKANVIFKHYEDAIENYNKQYFELLDKSKEQKLLYDNSLKESYTFINSVNRTMELNNTTLKHANSSLDTASKLINKSKNKQFWMDFGCIVA